MKKIYLAGPDVFKKDPVEYGKRLKDICNKHGLQGLFPLDNELDLDNYSPKIAAKMIQQSNIELIKSCDGVVANLNSFRGCEPDSGTVWEVGFATGLEKKVIGYTDDLRTLKEKTIESLKLDKDSQRDNEDLLIEDFGLSHNLMFADIVCCDSFEKAIIELKKIL